MRFSLIVVSIFVSAASFAQVNNLDGRLNSIEAAEKACLDKADNTAAINGCSYDKLQNSDKLLNEVYQDRVSNLKAQALKEKDASQFEKYAEETLQRLIKAQRAWITFRDADCDLQGANMLNGTGEGMIIGGCLAEKTFKRVKEIAEVSL